MDSIIDFINEDYLPYNPSIDPNPISSTTEEASLAPALTPASRPGLISETGITTGISAELKAATAASIAAFESALMGKQPPAPNGVNPVNVKAEDVNDINNDDVKVKKERGASEPPLLARSGSENGDGGEGDRKLHQITTVKKPDEDGDGDGDALQDGPNADAAMAGPQQIQAYAKLEFSFLNFYIQKLSVIIGRRPPPAPAPAPVKPANAAEAKDETLGVAGLDPLSLELGDINGLLSQMQAQSQLQSGDSLNEIKLDGDAPSAAASAGGLALPQFGLPQQPADEAVQAPAATAAQATANSKIHVDVDLGPIKAVSRDHARLFFDTEIDPRTGFSYGWSIEVRGRNGLVVDGSWKAKDEVVRLNNGSKIQIAERVFFFRLPYGVEYPQAPPAEEEPMEGSNGMYGYGADAQHDAGEHESPVIYGSDSEELRSDDEGPAGSAKAGLESAGPSTSAPRRQRGATPDSPVSGDNDPSYTGKGGPKVKAGGRKKKLGRPPKVKTAAEIAAIENAPKKVRGRPPKNAQPQPIAPAPAPGATIASAPLAESAPEDLSTPLNAIPETANMTKKQISELRRQEKEKAKEEKARQKDAEKAEKEAQKLAKKEQKAREDAEKKAAVKGKATRTQSPSLPPPLAQQQQTQPAHSGLALPAQAAPPLPVHQQQQQFQPAAHVYAPAQPIIPASVPAPAPSYASPMPAHRAPPPPQQLVATNQFQFKPDKPPYSYAALIAQAIYATPNRQATLPHIHAWIPEHYPYFKAHFGVLQANIKQNLAVNRAFTNIPLASGIALWAVEAEQAKYFDGNTFLTPPQSSAPVMPQQPHLPRMASPAVQQPNMYQSMSPAPVHAINPAYQSPAPAPAPAAAPSKIPILISTLPPSYQKPPAPSSLSASDPSSMLDPHGYPPIAVHEGKMYLSPVIFATLTAQQLSNLQTLETKQALNILQAFVVNYFKVELKKKKKAEKAAAAAAAAAASMSPAPQAHAGAPKRPADQSLEGMAKVQKVS